MNQKMSFDEQEQLSRSLIAVNPHRNGNKGNLSALLNMWQKRGHIKKNMDGTYSKTEAFVLKNGHYGAPVAA